MFFICSPNPNPNRRRAIPGRQDVRPGCRLGRARSKTCAEGARAAHTPLPTRTPAPPASASKYTAPYASPAPIPNRHPHHPIPHHLGCCNPLLTEPAPSHPHQPQRNTQRLHALEPSEHARRANTTSSTTQTQPNPTIPRLLTKKLCHTLKPGCVLCDLYNLDDYCHNKIRVLGPIRNVGTHSKCVLQVFFHNLAQ
jgi:hypothetical protein